MAQAVINNIKRAWSWATTSFGVFHAKLMDILLERILPLLLPFFLVITLFIIILPLKLIPSIFLELLIGSGLFLFLRKKHKENPSLILMSSVIVLISWIGFSFTDKDSLHIVEEFYPLPIPDGKFAYDEQITSTEDFNFRNYITNVFSEDTDGDALKDDLEKTNTVLIANSYYPNNFASGQYKNVADVCSILGFSEDLSEQKLLENCLSRLPELERTCSDSKNLFSINTFDLACDSISPENIDYIHQNLMNNEKLIN